MRWVLAYIRVTFFQPHLLFLVAISSEYTSCFLQETYSLLKVFDLRLGMRMAKIIVEVPVEFYLAWIIRDSSDVLIRLVRQQVTSGRGKNRLHRFNCDNASSGSGHSAQFQGTGAY